MRTGPAAAVPSRNAAPASAIAAARDAQRPAASSPTSPARHAKRSAIRAKPAGMTSWLHATRMPKVTRP